MTDPVRFRGTPFCQTFPTGVWPVRSAHRLADVVTYKTEAGVVGPSPLRRFGAPRNGGARIHVGVDLYAREGDPVIAIEDGIVVRNRGVYVSGTRKDGSRYTVRRLLVNHGTAVIGYCEVAIDDELDRLEEGTAVRRGDEIARVGKMRVSSMLHVEAYMIGTTRGYRWLNGQPKPVPILDPTAMLLALRQRAIEGDEVTKPIEVER